MAVNLFADSLSRTWAPGDISTTDVFLSSLQAEYQIYHVAFSSCPLYEHLIARQKYLQSEMDTNWWDGKARLWTPFRSPFPRGGQDTGRGSDRSAGGSSVACSCLVRALAWLELSPSSTRTPYGNRRGSLHVQKVPQFTLGIRAGRDRVRASGVLVSALWYSLERGLTQPREVLMLPRTYRRITVGLTLHGRAGAFKWRSGSGSAMRIIALLFLQKRVTFLLTLDFCLWRVK